MKSYHFVLPIALLFITVTAIAEETSKKSELHEKTIKATYLITGLHCPPCTKTVESSLQNVKGIDSINVDWKSKDARIEFDESLLPAQKVAELIADTPHMMGRSMHYGGWLLLKSADIKDEDTAKRAKTALSKVEGVKSAAGYPKQHAIGVQFGQKGDLTTKQLIEALKKVGLTAST
jgi:copper chaperone CopZ